MRWRPLAALTLVAWGALAFGAVYRWAFIPLFAGCVALGLAGLVAARNHKWDWTGLPMAFGTVVLAISAQLIPLPAHVLQIVSPQTDALLRAYEVGYPLSSPHHPLSIAPPQTAMALAITVALMLMTLGMMNSLSARDARFIVRGIAILGVILALLAIAQKALSPDRIYGFWTPVEGGNPFGPFVNKNHFAGWMLMGIPLATGYFCGRVSRGMRGVSASWRERLVWMSSADASETILIAFAMLTMALSLTLTFSRSAIVGLMVAVAISIAFVTRRYPTVSRRRVAAAYLAFVFVGAIAWAGFDKVVHSFSGDDIVTLNNRLGIWENSLEIARLFPFAGTGLNTFGVSALFHQTVLPDKHLAQAHNDYLQLTAEGGMLLIVPIIFAIVVAIRTIRARFRQLTLGSDEYWLRVGSVTGIVAIALQETAEFSLQMPGNSVLFVVLLAIAARPVTPATTSRN